ncbi:MAG: DUF1611 domain-containing protein [Candidatus Dormibacteria bacterium]
MSRPLGPSPAAQVGDRLILYTAGRLAAKRGARTAEAMLRFQPDRVRAVLDPPHAGRRLGDVCPWFSDADTPVIGSLAAAAAMGETVVVGFAPDGGAFSTVERALLTDALTMGLRVVNGLHESLGPAAMNLRAFDPADRSLGRGLEARSLRILTVGTSAGVGKMTTTVLLTAALRARGCRAEWLATGQTGLLLQGFGRVVDAIPVDFVPGVLESLLTRMESDHEVIVVEGQGSVFHPAYAPSALALLHTIRPRHLVLGHRLGQQSHRGFGGTLPTLEQAVAGHEKLADALGFDCTVLSISLDSSSVDQAVYKRERLAIERRLGVPCCDPLRESPAHLISTLPAP